MASVTLQDFPVFLQGAAARYEMILLAIGHFLRRTMSVDDLSPGSPARFPLFSLPAAHEVRRHHFGSFPVTNRPHCRTFTFGGARSGPRDRPTGSPSRSFPDPLSFDSVFTSGAAARDLHCLSSAFRWESLSETHLSFRLTAPPKCESSPMR